MTAAPQADESRPRRRRRIVSPSTLLVALLTLSLGANAADAGPSRAWTINPDQGVTIGGTRVTITGVDVGAATFAQVAAGSRHSIGLTDDGTLYGWGDNSSGQLGDGTEDSSPVPVAVDVSGALMGKEIEQVVVGNSFSAALTVDGHVFTWGDNTVGQLGNATEDEGSLVPTPIAEAGGAPVDSVVRIAAGGAHALALDASGQVYGWGSAASGQVGNGSTNGYIDTPYALANNYFDFTSVKQIEAGENHSVAVTDGGTSVYAWGHNAHGQIGNGRTVRAQATPTAATEINTLLDGRSVIGLGGGLTHSVAVLSDGEVYAWGGNDQGQLGDGSTDSSLDPVLVERTGPDGDLGDIAAVAVCGASNYVVTAEGALYAWGTNLHGQLGNGSEEDLATSPVEVDRTGTLAGAVVSRVSASAQHAVAIDSAGQVHTWGGNEHGQRGDGSTSTAPTPVRLLTHVVRFGEGGPLGTDEVVDVAAGTLSVTTPQHAEGVVPVFIEPPQAPPEP